ncbi:MAG: hypothetical protein CM1200mP9_08740 [Gammaproteobacteria bacterium]|nr:MAG: hypothetical protein CM1200mP9_08740 [Gammaproteobacteria bacterium]
MVRLSFTRGIVIEAARGEMNLTDDRVVMEGTEFVLFEPEIRGRADRIERVGNRLVFEGTSLTRCQPDRDVWVFRAKSLDMDEDAVFAIAHKAKVEVFGVPVVALPGFGFPHVMRAFRGFCSQQLGTDQTTVSISRCLTTRISHLITTQRLRHD